MTKHVTICADDYGQNPAVGQAIRELAEKGRISATSCLVTSPYWPQEALLLKPLENKIDIGLHLNLTEGAALTHHFRTYPSLPKLMVLSALRLIKTQTIMDEINLQLDRFVEYFGRLPDYIDGHLHVVQLPVIRKALLSVYNLRLKNTKTYIRSTFTPERTSLKARIIHLTGAKAFKRNLEKQTIPHNDALIGNYDFKNASRFDQLFPDFLKKAGEKSIILCHPGIQNSAYQNDPSAHVRPHEYTYLKSDKFLKDCEQENVTIGRFKS